MILSQFIQSLHGQSACQVRLITPSEEIYTFKPVSNASVPERSILYIGFLPEMPTSGGDLTANFLCLETEGTDNSTEREALFSAFPTSNFLFLPWSGELWEMFDIVSNIFLAETQYTSQINRIVAASNSGQGLQHLIDEAYQITHSPIVVVDSSYRILAMCCDSASDNAFGLKLQREQGYMTEENLSRMQRDKLYEQLRQSPSKIRYGKAADSDYYWMDALVYVHGIEAAEIGMIESNHSFTRYDFEFMKFLKQLVAWEMQNESFFTPNRGLMHSIFLSELLEQKFTNPEAVERRRRMLRWSTGNCLRVFSVFSTEQDKFRQKAEFLCFQLQSLLPDSHWVITDTHLVFLVIKDKVEVEEFKPHKPLAERLRLNKMYGILSNSFSQLTDLKKYYHQTLAVREFKDLAEEDSPILLYSDFYIFHIAKLISEANDLKDFYHPAINMIRSYDEANHTRYLNTLYEYLTHIDSPAICAQNLCVHKNTFFYRMNKLRELFPVNLDDGRERMKLQITMEFIKLENYKSVVLKE